MSSHVYHEIYLHLNWHTKLSQPLLQPELEKRTHQVLTRRIRNTKGVWFHEINGTATHVHLAINIEPSVRISDLVKDLKGGSAYDVNSDRKSKSLHWQRGYGVVSFGKNNLDWVRGYIQRQKEHHSSDGIVARLEKVTMDEETDGPRQVV